MILQMLAARRSSSGKVNVAEMLAMLQGNGSPTTSLRMPDLLQQLSQTNPMLQRLLQQLGPAYVAQGPGEGRVFDAQAVEVRPAVEARSIEEPRPALEDARAGSADSSSQDPEEPDRESLLAEVSTLRERVDRCAAALGACGVCWGTDPACRACRGHGRPGFAMPDPELFKELIVPAARTLRARRSSVAPPTNNAHAAGSHPHTT
jgi:hypothetical protein